MASEPHLSVLHLGLGAFHRAHQAVVMQRLSETGDGAWTLASGNIRPDADASLEALIAQKGAYTLETVDPQGRRRYERITAIGTVIRWDQELTGLIEAAA